MGQFLTCEYNFSGIHRALRNCNDLFAGSESVMPAEANVFLGSLVLFTFVAVILAPILLDLVSVQRSRSVEHRIPKVRPQADMN